jgi:hypothetical protein
VRNSLFRWVTAIVYTDTAGKNRTYADVSEVGCRAWVMPESGDHLHAMGNNTFHFEELQIYGNAHLAFLTEPRNIEADVFFAYFIGDRTGTLHIGWNQTMDLERPTIDLPFNTWVYSGGFLGLAPVTDVHGVFIQMSGIMAHVVNFTIHHGGELYANDGGRTRGNNESVYQFQFARIQDRGMFHMETDPVVDEGITLITRATFIEGGATVRGTKVTFISENVTIDDGGVLEGDENGFHVRHGSSGYGMHGVINDGAGVANVNGGTGAGHGGSGGKARLEPRTGEPYGDIYQPYAFGSSGGSGPTPDQEHGGRGGGILWINVTDTIQLDGEITSNGGDAEAPYSGGGSGGAIWLHCRTIKGTGNMTAHGGNGFFHVDLHGIAVHPNRGGGGGAGGRIALYFVINNTFTGQFLAFGGDSQQEVGGPGTSFLYHMVEEHRTLVVHNGFRRHPWSLRIDNYANLTTDGARAWILPDSGTHRFAGGNYTFYFEELQIYGNAHLAVLTAPVFRRATLFFQFMIGDRSGVLHIARNQTMDLERSELDMPFSTFVYYGGYLGLGHFTDMHGVFMVVEGVIDHVYNLTLIQNAQVNFTITGSTMGQPEGSYNITNTVLIKADSELNMFTAPATPLPQRLFAQGLLVEGGGLIQTEFAIFTTRWLTVDDGGVVNASNGGFGTLQGPGKGFNYIYGDSGAGHGGRGGRGGGVDGEDHFLMDNGAPYGNPYEAKAFGSGGGGPFGGKGGGRLEFYVQGIMTVDGQIEASSYILNHTWPYTIEHYRFPALQDPVRALATYSYGGAYYMGTREFWYPSFCDLCPQTTVYRYARDTNTLLGTFTLRDSNIFQLWADLDDTIYSVNSRADTIRRFGAYPRFKDTILWTVPLGGVTAVSVDDDFVYAMRERDPYLYIISKETGQQVQPRRELLGGQPNFLGTNFYGGLAVLRGKVFHGMGNRVYRYDLATGAYDGTFWTVSAISNILTMAFTGQDLCVSDGAANAVFCYRVISHNIWDNEINREGSGGGSGGSIHIETGALSGGFTGVISVTGGGGDLERGGGGGSGGRISVYHNTPPIVPYFEGHYDLHGGRGHPSAEPGASGSLYVRDLGKNESITDVDNLDSEPLFPLTTFIPNDGGRINMTYGTSPGGPTGNTYTAVGVTVTASAGAVTGSSLSALFSNTYSDRLSDMYIANTAAATVTLTVNLGRTMNLTLVRVFPACGPGQPTDFSAYSQLGAVQTPITSARVELEMGCKQGSYIDLPVRRLASSYVLTLIRRTGSSIALSSLETFVDGVNASSRYIFIDQDSARTWIRPLPNQTTIYVDMLEIIGGAQIAFRSHDPVNAPAIDITLANVTGDFTGVLHVGPHQSVTVLNTPPDVPFSVRVYEKGRLDMPARAWLGSGVSFFISGHLSTVDEILVFNDGVLFVDTNATINTAVPGTLGLKTLEVHDRGFVDFYAHDVAHEGFDLAIANLTMYGGGELHSNTRLNFTCDNLIVGSGAHLNLDHGGFITTETRNTGINTEIGRQFYDEDEGRGQGHPSVAGSSGAGHGGSGGRGQGAPFVGLAYGNLFRPIEYGSNGGHGVDYGRLIYGDLLGGQTDTGENQLFRAGQGGRGGGVLQIQTNLLQLDGLISVNGEPGLPEMAGGGSGGSILIYCKDIAGYGSMTADGGEGNANGGGGGSGGRVAIYHTMYDDLHNFNGTITARGGLGFLENGGPGTVYLQGTNGTHIHRILQVDNGGIHYPWAVVKAEGRLHDIYLGNYSDIRMVGGVGWLHYDTNTTDYDFEELRLGGNAHMAVLTGPWRSNAQTVTLDTLLLTGDRTGMLHVGASQTFKIETADVYFPANALVYERGWLSMPTLGRTNLREVFIDVNGTLATVTKVNVDKDGWLRVSSVGNSPGLPPGSYFMEDVIVKADGRLLPLTLANRTQVTTNITRLAVKAGGRVNFNSYHLKTYNLTVDAFGEMDGDSRGHEPGTGRSPGLDTVIVDGTYTIGVGATGGGHGGRGGAAPGRLAVTQPYGSALEPDTYGSPGGYGLGTNGAPQPGSAGGGKLKITCTGVVRVEGRIHVNGQAATLRFAGGGAGGSLWIITPELSGDGTLEANGGNGWGSPSQFIGGGGGGGGRIAVYTFNSTEHTDPFIGEYQARGGAGSMYQGNLLRGGAGTVFLYNSTNATDHITTLLVDNGEPDVPTPRFEITRQLDLSGGRFLGQ